jgi:hypothetical protein
VKLVFLADCNLECQNEGTLNRDTCTCDCVGGFSERNCSVCPVECQNGATFNEVECTCSCAEEPTVKCVL